MTSTKRPDRAREAIQVLEQEEGLSESSLKGIEEAALKDGYEGQRVSALGDDCRLAHTDSLVHQCYTHPHMNAV